jgi:hypothetical protein
MLDQMANEIKLISGSSHVELSNKVASRYVALNLRLPALPRSVMLCLRRCVQIADISQTWY